MRGNNTLLKKVIILFVIVLIPLILTSSVYLHRRNQQHRKQTLDAILSNNITYMSHLDENLKQIYSSNAHMVEQNLLRNLAVRFSSLPAYEKGVQINLLRDQLYSISTASPFLESAHAYLFNEGTVYNSVNYKYGSYQSLNENENEFYQTLSTQRGLMQYYVDPIHKQKTLSVFMAPVNRNASYAVNLILSNNALKTYLASNASYDGEYYLFSLENGFTLQNLPYKKTEDAQNHLNQFSAETDAGYQEITLDGEDYIAFFDHTSYSGGTYVRFIPNDILMHSIHYSYNLMMIFYLLIIVACILFFIGIYRMVHKPLVGLTDAFTQIEKGNFQIHIPEPGSGDFAYLYHAFNNMAVQLNRLIEQDYNQKLLLQKAELKQLQAQINPHFLYNSFFMLQRMIRFNSEEAQEVAGALATCFRYITKNSMDNVTLLEEYDYAKNYAYIQGLRFEGRISIELGELPKEFATIPVPKLILQPILENAFNYGLNNKISDGLIRVSFLTDASSLIIRIEDNGEELTDTRLSQLKNRLYAASNSYKGVEMSGILNIQRRLNIFSNCEDSLRISRSDLGGLCVEIVLQLKEDE